MDNVQTTANAIQNSSGANVQDDFNFWERLFDFGEGFINRNGKPSTVNNTYVSGTSGATGPGQSAPAKNNTMTIVLVAVAVVAIVVTIIAVRK